MPEIFTKKRIRIEVYLRAGKFEDGNNVLIIDDLPMHVDIKKEGIPSFPEANITIWGLSMNKMKALSMKGHVMFQSYRNRVKIYAGDGEPSQLPLVFVGDQYFGAAQIDSQGEARFDMKAFTGIYRPRRHPGSPWCEPFPAPAGCSSSNGPARPGRFSIRIPRQDLVSLAHALIEVGSSQPKQHGSHPVGVRAVKERGFRNRFQIVLLTRECNFSLSEQLLVLFQKVANGFRVGTSSRLNVVEKVEDFRKQSALLQRAARQSDVAPKLRLAGVIRLVALPHLNEPHSHAFIVGAPEFRKIFRHENSQHYMCALNFVKSLDEVSQLKIRKLTFPHFQKRPRCKVHTGEENHPGFPFKRRGTAGVS